MTILFRATHPLLLVLSLALSSAGRADPFEEIGRCTAISADAERLRCFDAAARALPNVDAVAGDTGAWTVVRPAAGAGATAGRAAATQGPSGPDNITLTISCADGRPSLSAAREPVIARSASTLVTLHVNDRLVLSDLWSSSSNYQSAAMPGDVAAFLRGLPATGKLSLQFEGSRGFRFEGIFELAGIETVRRRIVDACR
ncbi:hypothetical protein [Phreatobacter sp. AB_2022a]|uniref:hypothetical protein n=1 Tax=Phreatobacter sp. AB_2022a TaxID=3003134 RepID=UPI0022871AC3|nr:hypothetical protein [Phreatobacter sp. AB_2022a]MCZ0732608.1 hypothetical protein [Phreatobacter sp. AB_2022a]